MTETTTTAAIAGVPVKWLAGPLKVIDNPAKRSSSDPAFQVSTSDGWPVGADGRPVVTNRVEKTPDPRESPRGPRSRESPRPPVRPVHRLPDGPGVLPDVAVVLGAASRSRRARAPRRPSPPASPSGACPWPSCAARGRRRPPGTRAARSPAPAASGDHAGRCTPARPGCGTAARPVLLPLPLEHGQGRRVQDDDPVPAGLPLRLVHGQPHAPVRPVHGLGRQPRQLARPRPGLPQRPQERGQVAGPAEVPPTSASTARTGRRRTTAAPGSPSAGGPG
jgi:hypothetical protein